MIIAKSIWFHTAVWFRKINSRLMTKQTKWHLCWSESSLSAWRNTGSSAIHWAHRLIWVFAGSIDHFVGFVMRRLIYSFIYLFERVSEKMVLKTLQYYSINLYVIKSTFKKRTEVQNFFCFYNEFKIILTMVLKPLMFHTKSMINLMHVAMTTIAPLYHKFPLKHHKSFWKPVRQRNVKICVIW